MGEQLNLISKAITGMVLKLNVAHLFRAIGIGVYRHRFVLLFSLQLLLLLMVCIGIQFLIYWFMIHYL